MPTSAACASRSVPNAAPVSAAARLAYVLKHFWQAYEDAPAIGIGYGEGKHAVTIADGAGSFFEEALAYPSAPTYRTWNGQQVPFFFDGRPDFPLLELGNGVVQIHADVMAAAFYLLSGWQEYFSPARDQHGRFPYAESVQKQFKFVALPVVNYYFDVLKTAVEHVTGEPLKPRQWNGAPFAAFITHDIDSLHGGWGPAARYHLRQGRPGGLFCLLGTKLLRRAGPWNNLEKVQAETARFGAPSTFFILGDHRPAGNGVSNADYQAASPRLQAQLRQLASRGSEIGSHASYGTATDPVKLRRELNQFVQFHPLGNRFHYLCWEPTVTPTLVAQAGIAYDSTLGFAEHFGFRNSYCLPFFPFDFSRGQAHSFLEIPLNVMDATLHHPNYLQLRPEEILPALQPMFAEIEQFGGVATVLWHNANFDPTNTVNGPHQFRTLLTHLKQRGAAFLTGHDIYQRFTA